LRSPLGTRRPRDGLRFASREVVSGYRTLPKARRFHLDTMAGFAVIIVLLTTGMGLAVREIEEVTARQLADMESHEHGIAAATRLRWSGELLGSAGRGYLISGDRAQLGDLRSAARDFDATLRELEGLEFTPRGEILVEEVRRSARTFRSTQERLLSDRGSTKLSELEDRFETELIPARAALRAALDQLVGHKRAKMESVYVHAKHQRKRLMDWVHGLLAALVLGGICVAWGSGRRLERMYRREEEAVKAAREALGVRDEIMGIVAHDLRSPLGAITMRAELLRDTTTDPNARRQAAAINSTATRMAYLINSMLDVTVIESGHLTVRAEPCEADRFVNETVDMFAVIAGSKGIQLESRVSEPGLVVLVDRERVIQVLSNLVGNAMKFTPQGGKVTLSVERSGDFAMFAVSDSGPGIPAADLTRVFDRYWKDEARGTKGTGLGLFIAKSIIDAHGGKIAAESRPGHGATFRFKLRLAGSGTTKGADGWQTS
jgi:signal transduction histidine kinase